MFLDEHQVSNIALLARIAINQKDIGDYTQDLSNILTLIDQLQNAPTDNISPLSNPLEQSQRLRPDTVTETNQRDQFQRHAPLTEQGLYLVPRVIE